MLVSKDLHFCLDQKDILKSVSKVKYLFSYQSFIALVPYFCSLHDWDDYNLQLLLHKPSLLIFRGDNKNNYILLKLIMPCSKKTLTLMFLIIFISFISFYSLFQELVLKKIIVLKKVNILQKLNTVVMYQCFSNCFGQCYFSLSKLHVAVNKKNK
jgi:hypothetical protein